MAANSSLSAGTVIPPEFIDLVDCPPVAALTTVMPDGSPRTSVVWCDFDGTYVRINTMRGFRKEKKTDHADQCLAHLSSIPCIHGTVPTMGT